MEQSRLYCMSPSPNDSFDWLQPFCDTEVLEDEWINEAVWQFTLCVSSLSSLSRLGLWNTTDSSQLWKSLTKKTKWFDLETPVCSL